MYVNIYTRTHTHTHTQVEITQKRASEPKEKAGDRFSLDPRRGSDSVAGPGESTPKFSRACWAEM